MKHIALAALFAFALAGCATPSTTKPAKDGQGNYVLQQEAYLCYGLFQAPGCMQRAALERVRGKAEKVCMAEQHTLQEVRFETGQQRRYSNQTSIADGGALFMAVTYHFRCV